MSLLDHLDGLLDALHLNPTAAIIYQARPETKLQAVIGRRSCNEKIYL